MRKFLLAAVCAMCTLAASAQRAHSTSSTFFSTEKSDKGVTFGIRAGVNFATLTGDMEDAKTRTAYHVGVIADIPLMQSLYIQTGLYLQSKGMKVGTEYGEDKYTEKLDPLYIQIPVLASYRYDFNEATQLQVNFGPYFAVGVAGKSKFEYDGYGNGEDMDGEYDAFGDDGALNRFDCGLQVGAGITFATHFNVSFTYEFGLTNVYNTDKWEEVLSSNGDRSVKNSNIMISLGYNF